jgi:hypothetical protein
MISGEHSAASDTGVVLGVNGAVVGLIHLVDLRTMLEVTLLILSIAFTIWRWRRAAKSGKDPY